MLFEILAICLKHLKILDHTVIHTYTCFAQPICPRVPSNSDCDVLVMLDLIFNIILNKKQWFVYDSTKHVVRNEVRYVQYNMLIYYTPECHTKNNSQARINNVREWGRFKVHHVAAA